MGEAMLQLAKEERHESAKDGHAAHNKHAGVEAPPSTGERSGAMQPGTKATGQQPGFLSNLLQDAERLLAYSAEMGIEVEPDIRSTILKARATSKWDENIADQMLDVLARLAHQLKPVTPQSLRDCEEHDEKRAMRTYKLVAVVLALFIVPYSVATFVTSAISDAIRKDIVVANALAVKLTDELNVFLPGATSVAPTRTDIAQTRADRMTTLKDLQQLAATTRAIDGRARLLSFFVCGLTHDPFADKRGNADELKSTFEVPLPLPDLSAVAAHRIGVYQQVRYFAVATEEAASVFYGAMASGILPVLYALLGACAFLLRTFEQQVKARTFTLNDAHAARFVIAAIGGAVVGLFSNFTLTQSASIPPLAIAFLVGYAVDVFFSFLESLLQSVSRGKGAGSAPAPDYGGHRKHERPIRPDTERSRASAVAS